MRPKDLRGQTRARVTGRAEPGALWWLHPRFAVLCFGVTFLIGAYLLPWNVYHNLFRTAKYVDLNFVVVGLVVYAGFLVGTFFVVSTGKRSQWRDVLLYCRWVLWPLFLLTVFGYVAWFTSAMLNAGGPIPLLNAMWGVLTAPGVGAGLDVKTELFQTVPGVTTCTQFGILYATVEALLWVNRASNRRLALARVAVIASFTIPRAMLLAERGAFLEIAIPAAVILLSSMKETTSLRRTLIRLAPLYLVPLVFALFALAEYFRSWTFYKPIYAGDFFAFSLHRFLGYYVTSVNNAAVYYYHAPLQPLRYTFASLLEFPGIGAFLARVLDNIFGDTYVELPQVLGTYANYEFNTVAVFGVWLNEYSLFLAPIVAFVMGVFSSSLYTSFVQGRFVGLLLFPSWFTGLVEISRYYHWTNSRYFPALAFLVISVVWFRAVKGSAAKRAVDSRVNQKKALDKVVLTTRRSN